MKWFKHLVDSAGDPDLDNAYGLFGGDADHVFWRTLEIMSREFDVNDPGVCSFSVHFLRGKYRCSWRKAVKILSYFSQKKRIVMTELEIDSLPGLRLYCPKLKELCDEWTRKKLASLKTHSGVAPDQKPTIDIDPEPEPDPDISTPPKPPEGKATLPYGRETYEKHPILFKLHDCPMLRGITLQQYLLAKRARSPHMDFMKATDEVIRRALMETGGITKPARFLDVSWSYWEQNNIENIRAREKRHEYLMNELEVMKITIRDLRDNPEDAEMLARMRQDFKSKFGEKLLARAEREAAE